MENIEHNTNQMEAKIGKSNDPVLEEASLHSLQNVEYHKAHKTYEDPSLKDLPLTIGNIPRLLLLLLIRGYQLTFSRTLPPNSCRFYPTCSHYGYQAIYKYGAIKGGLMATWRVIRCNPFNKGGIDPVP